MHAGDVVWVDFGVPAGSEPGFVRPAIVVTANIILASGPRTVHVLPVTTNVKRSLPTEVPIQAAGLERPSAAQCHLCTVISSDRILTPDHGNIGNIGNSSLAQVRSLLADLLDIL